MPEITIKVLKPGTRVHDDLLNREATIIGVQIGVGRTPGARYPDNHAVIGYWVDNAWLGGGRHPWEISKPRKSKGAKKNG